jgi:hypothetical protein
VAPDVTLGDDDVEVGPEDDADDDEEDEEDEDVPVLPVVPVVPASEEPDRAPDDEDPPVVVAVDGPVDAADVPDARVAVAPGWSCATTMPMATVAPVAATITERVRTRRRAWALSLSAGVRGW